MTDLAVSFFEAMGVSDRSPCIYGNYVPGHAVYCEHPDGLRKCPIYRNYGIGGDAYWHSNGDWDEDDWNGGCKLFEVDEEYEGYTE